ncbi:class I SAM-dependent methyltransferase [Kiloniella majae]|uniref:class I SAM-dependent methyltransferase n=1 Tax=Kiloniella majae TaxID=1938558 RepID=UPI000A277C46|nr:class I SAM-dependent methyltransferase [Kiloniella majae]
MTSLKDTLRRLYVLGLRSIKKSERSQDYWNRHHVDNPDSGFDNVNQSLEHLAWRNSMYPGQTDLLGYEIANDARSLDYGCGPGNDVIGLGSGAKPRELHAMDVSSQALNLAQSRAKLHEIDCQFHKIEENDAQLPLDDSSLDYIQSMGVLHHTPDPIAIMKEFHRLLSSGGQGRIMVYNRDSIWRHLHVAWEFQIEKGLYRDLTPDQAFAHTTDGYNCPIANCYRPPEFVEMCESAGFKARFVGSAVSLLELRLLPRIWEALGDKQLPIESRKFLSEIRFDDRGFPIFNEQVAGLNAFYEIKKA